MLSQKTLAVVGMKKRCMVVEFLPRYWALGLGIGRRNYHLQVGPIAVSLTKKVY